VKEAGMTGTMRWAIALLLLCGPSAQIGLAAPDKDGREPKPISVDEAKKILEGLEHGMGALKALGRHDEVKRLAKIADELRAKLKAGSRADDERAMAKERIETMRIAMHGLLEAEKRDLAHRLEQAIHALELRLEGRRDPEALKVYEGAPNREQQIELLIHAVKIWDELGHETKAERIETLVRELKARGGERRKEEGRGDRREREIVERRIEVMKMALPALLEAEKRDAADLLERSIHAYRLLLEGRRDAEAREIIGAAPSRGQQAEILALAGNLWRKFGNADKAEACLRLARELGVEAKRKTDRARPSDADRRVAGLEARLAEMQKMLDEMRAEMERLRKDRK
jgi:hypothetical protein